MKKYLIILVAAVVAIGGWFYRDYSGGLPSVSLAPAPGASMATSKTVDFSISTKQGQWRFVPEQIEVEKGDKVLLTLINEDDYEHGFALNAFGVSQRMPAKSTTKVEFVVNQEGEFPYYCSVPCGSGEVDGVKRSHLDMKGKIRVKLSR